MHYEIFEGGKSLGVTKEKFPADNDQQAKIKAKNYINGQTLRVLAPRGKTMKLVKLFDPKGRPI